MSSQQSRCPFCGAAVEGAVDNAPKATPQPTATATVNEQSAAPQRTLNDILAERQAQAQTTINDTHAQEAKAEAKALAAAQFAQYGMANVPEDLLENYAKEMLKQDKTREALINRAVDVKLINAIKGVVTLEEEKVSVEDFNKKVSENA